MYDGMHQEGSMFFFSFFSVRSSRNKIDSVKNQVQSQVGARFNASYQLTLSL